MQHCERDRIMIKNKCVTCPYHSEKCDEISKERRTYAISDRDTLCWCCIHAVPDRDQHGCPWSEFNEPVPGWEAVEKTINLGGRRSLRSYFVITCPMFERG